MKQPTLHPVGVRVPLPGVVYPPQDALRTYAEAGVLTHETLADGLRAAFALHADRPALCLPQRVMSYRELDEATDRLAAALLELGVRPTERVLFHLGNSLEMVLGWIACLKAAIIPVCTLAAHRELELGYLGRHSAAVMHFIAGDDTRFDSLGFARRLRAQVPSLRWILQARGPAGEGAEDVALLHGLIADMPLELARQVLARLEPDPWQAAVFQLSGGTTGVPKIIPRFNNEYLYNMRQVARVNGYREDDVLLMPLPMMHNLSMGCCVGPFLLSGGAYAIAPDLVPETLERLFTQYQPTWAVMGGPILERLRPAIERLRRDPARAPAAEEAAALCALSPAYFSRRFHQQLGMPWSDYVRAHRLHLACQRLLESRRSVASIANELGFASPSHFGELFQRRFGVTPHTYRRKGR